MKRALMPVLLSTSLGACVLPLGPSRVDRQVAFWKWQEAVEEARQDADFDRKREELARERPAQDAAEQREAARFGALIHAQSMADAKVGPKMDACLVSDAHTMARKLTAPANQVADAVLLACRPAIEAVARTVELADVSSDGLADEITARLRARVVARVVIERAQAQPHPAASLHGGTATN